MREYERSHVREQLSQRRDRIIHNWNTIVALNGIAQGERTCNMTYTATIGYRAGSKRNPWLPILEGWRGEIIDGLGDRMVYTGVCKTRQECIAELIGQLKAMGLTGKLKLV